ncbi:MAG: leucyl aminopeptidase [Hyphomicrobiaceae bacterium]
MTNRLDIVFAPISKDTEATTVVLVGDELSLAPLGRKFNTKSDGGVLKSAEVADFKGKTKSTVEILAPHKLDLSRLMLVGCGTARDMSESDWIMLGGYTLGQLSARKTKSASLVAEVPDGGDIAPEDIAVALAFGAQLRNYKFDKYISDKSKDDEDSASKVKLRKLIIHCENSDKAKKLFAAKKAIANGVHFARDLVNEPANTLGPVELAEATKSLESLGVEVEILDVEALSALKMNALLSVGQGSERPSRVAVMHWRGAKSKKAKPVAFVGKGVVFDTGGISMKPSSGMGDMKGDMGGSACVVGVMHALAERKAAVNAVGLIGCVENMPSGSATRPGDIVRGMSGQTIENLNTDAEGRLVLADVLWYAQERFKPKLVIDLATLTGAIMIALGKEYAGLYSNDDKLAEGLQEAAKVTGEKIWRMPLDKAFDKLIDSKNADMKNIGGRWGGANTAAHFIQRHIKDTAWAHIDLAGTAMDANPNDINQSWGSGWGVRLLDQFIADNHEDANKDKKTS